ISKKKAEKYKEGLTEMADGMNGMGEKLQEISVNIKENATGQSLPDFESKISEMEKLIGRMVEGQKKLERGSGELLDGYSNMGSQLKDVAMKLQQSAIQMENNAEGPAGHKQAAKFKHFGVKLNAMGDKMIDASVKSAGLPNVSGNTINGLQGLDKGLKNQQSQLHEISERQGQQQKDLQELAGGLAKMGENLVSMSENLREMIAFS